MIKIGFFAGTFDPVHRGHIDFARLAAQKGKLEKVYFLPEADPRGKSLTSKLADRTAMLKIATAKVPELEVMELPHGRFSVAKTLPLLASRFPDRQMVFLFGSDIAKKMAEWPDIDGLFSSSEIIVALRDEDNDSQLMALLHGAKVIFIGSPQRGVSSAKIRTNSSAAGLDPAVKAYITRRNLYS